MDLLTQLETHWYWFGLSFVLLALEAIFGSFRYLAVSVAASAMGGLTYLYTHVGLPAQLLFFALGSGVFIWIARSIVNERTTKIARLQQIYASKAYVGREFTLTSPIIEQRGSLDIDDYCWRLTGDDSPEGAKVRVVEMGEGWLKVEPVA
ncbi:MAG: NfeD family protein [Gammaproteobacteria bacterium]|nr:NfeD family protein [Gammaproteobacteria bacterium]